MSKRTTSEQVAYDKRVALAKELLNSGSYAAAIALMHAASAVAEDHREYVVKYHSSHFTNDDNDIIQHWKSVAHEFYMASQKLGGLSS